MTEETRHASCVAYGNHGLLILGRSGAGKSSLTMELLALGATLIADDRTILQNFDGRLHAQCPPAIHGLIEARGVGLLHLPANVATTLKLAVDLDEIEPDRLPPRRTITILGVEIDLVFGKDTPILAPALHLWMQGGRAD